MRQHQTLFANFICKFGDRNMIDLLREVVLPAFTDDKLYREARGSTFHLLDVCLFDSLTNDVSEPAIAGQFVQDTTLVRDQVFDPATSQLISDEAKLDTSPSAFFVLLLKDHRLIYFAETRFAPSLASFQSTMQRFLIRKHRDYIDKLHDEGAERGERVYKRVLKEGIPVPTLEIVQITNGERLSEFVQRFAKLQRVDLIIHRKNDEPTAASLIASAEAFNEMLKGKQTRVTTTDNEGLDKEGTISALQETTDGANETVRFSGLDHNGDRLKGENEDFSVTTIIENLVGTVKQKANALLDRFNAIIARGELKRPDVPQQAAARAAAAVREDDQQA